MIARRIEEDEEIERIPSNMKREEHRVKRKATRPSYRRWTNNIVPYALAGGTFSELSIE